MERLKMKIYTLPLFVVLTMVGMLFHPAKHKNTQLPQSTAAASLPATASHPAVR
jgi:hypothetical protein